MNLFQLMSFGYMPAPHFWTNLKLRIGGHPNLIKRLTARKLMKLVEPKQGENILDFGCGARHFSWELARTGAYVVAADVVGQSKAPIKVKHGTVRCERINTKPPLSFPDNTFDTILVSGVVLYLDDPIASAKDLLRVLKPGGKIVIVHNLGRIQIKKAYERKSLLIRLALWKNPQAPTSFEQFEKLFFEIEGSPGKKWLSHQELDHIFSAAGFIIKESSCSIKGAGLRLLYWIQFYKVVLKKRLDLKYGVIRYLGLELISALWPYYDQSLVGIVGIKPSKDSANDQDELK